MERFVFFSFIINGHISSSPFPLTLPQDQWGCRRCVWPHGRPQQTAGRPAGKRRRRCTELGPGSPSAFGHRRGWCPEWWRHMTRVNPGEHGAGLFKLKHGTHGQKVRIRGGSELVVRHRDPTFFIFAPSRRSQSCLHRAAPPGRGSGRRPPGRSSTSARCRVAQTGCCHAAWRSGSRPAEGRRPPSPGEESQGNTVRLCCYMP